MVNLVINSLVTYMGLLNLRLRLHPREPKAFFFGASDRAHSLGSESPLHTRWSYAKGSGGSTSMALGIVEGQDVVPISERLMGGL